MQFLTNFRRDADFAKASRQVWLRDMLTIYGRKCTSYVSLFY